MKKYLFLSLLVLPFFSNGLQVLYKNVTRGCDNSKYATYEVDELADDNVFYLDVSRDKNDNPEKYIRCCLLDYDDKGVKLEVIPFEKSKHGKKQVHEVEYGKAFIVEDESCGVCQELKVVE